MMRSKSESGPIFRIPLANPGAAAYSLLKSTKGDQGD
jgi:hypothetical protein